MDAHALPPAAAGAIASSEIGSESASVQAIPATLEGLLAQHGSDPGADSRTRIRPSLLASFVHDLHVGLGMGLALAAALVVGPTPHMVGNAFGFGLAASIAILALGRPGRAQGRTDLVLATLLCGLVAVVAGIGTGIAPLGSSGTALLLGATLMAGLVLACVGLHAGRGLPQRLARVVAPVVPMAAMLAVH